MKIKTLAIIGLLALAPVTNAELNAAPKPAVKVVRDDSGKVDYKNFYKNGKRVKYEDWNKGKKVKVTEFKSGKVSSKTYYDNGVKTKYEIWENGKVVQRNTYSNGRVKTKSFYKNGVKIEHQNWKNGKISEKRTYTNKKLDSRVIYNQNGKFKSAKIYENGALYRYLDTNTEIIYRANGKKQESLETVSESNCGTNKGLLCQKQTFYNSKGNVKSYRYVHYENHN